MNRKRPLKSLLRTKAPKSQNLYFLAQCKNCDVNYLAEVTNPSHDCVSRNDAIVEAHRWLKENTVKKEHVND